MNRNRLGAALLVASVAVLSGCGTFGQHTDNDPPGTRQTQGAGSDMSRVHLFGSLKELSGDSSAIVIGEVTSRTSVKDIDRTVEFTLSTFQISKVVKGDKQTTAGGAVIVRQTGGHEQKPPTPLFISGTQYLLYLTPSHLPSPLDTQYYVTGANAGVYQAGLNGAPTGTYVQPDHDKGDKIPVSVTLDQVTANLK